MKIGVLAVQGDAREHQEALAALGVQACPVRRPSDLRGLSGIILPGGESTAQWRLLARTGLAEALKAELSHGLPAFGTCAGLILLSRGITNWPERYFSVLDVDVERNATGRQVDSFETTVEVAGIGEVPALFIRAPTIKRMGPEVESLAQLGAEPVLVREGNHLGATFHPELTGDVRIHEMFLTICRKE